MKHLFIRLFNFPIYNLSGSIRFFYFLFFLFSLTVISQVHRLLTSTSRGLTTVSLCPCSGTTASSVPHGCSDFTASALTVKFTLPEEKKKDPRDEHHSSFLSTTGNPTFIDDPCFVACISCSGKMYGISYGAVSTRS